MPILLTVTLIIVAITCISVAASDWFARRALGANRPNSYEDVAILERGTVDSDAVSAPETTPPAP